MQLFLFLALFLALAFMFFAVQNLEVITVTLVTWTFEGSLAFILALAFSTGILTGILLFIPTLWRKLIAGRAQKKRIGELEKELLTFSEQQDAPEPAEMEEQL